VRLLLGDDPNVHVVKVLDRLIHAIFGYLLNIISSQSPGLHGSFSRCVLLGPQHTCIFLERHTLASFRRPIAIILAVDPFRQCFIFHSNF
jgi:hypothetical protein